MSEAQKALIEKALSLTDAAVAEILRLTQENDLPKTAGVRVGVQGGGCSGLSYVIDFDQKNNDLVLSKLKSK